MMSKFCQRNQDFPIPSVQTDRGNFEGTSSIWRQVTNITTFFRFGNLIGNPDDSDSDSTSSEDSFQRPVNEYSDRDSDDEDDEEDGEAQQQNQVILQEDKRHYSTMSQTFGSEVETMVQTHDTQSINEPLVKPKVDKFFQIEESKLPQTTYSKQYLTQLLSIPPKTRNVSFIGSLNSGKTTLLDSLILETHPKLRASTIKANQQHKRLRYTDNTKLEIERGLTLKTKQMSLLLPNLRGNSLVCNILDTPGHIDHLDEIAVAQRLTDISVIVLDIVEGLTMVTQKAIDNAMKNGLSLCLVVNKVDRLILELRLPPADSFYKIRDVIDEVNLYVKESPHYETYRFKESVRFSPIKNNVLFASADLGFLFTLKSFGKLYLGQIGGDTDTAEAFSKRLWGDIYYNQKTKRFSKQGEVRTFIHFIMEPLYKIITTTLARDADQLKDVLWSSFKLSVSNGILNSDPQILVRSVIRLIFRDSSGFVDMIESQPCPSDKQASKSHLFTGNSEQIATQIDSASSEGPLVASIAKMVDTSTALVRIYSGKLTKGTRIRVLGESYSVDDDEDQDVMTVNDIRLGCGRYSITLQEAYAGNVVLLGDVQSISKSGTIYAVEESLEEDQLAVFKPLDYIGKPVFKVVIEPRVPSELPKLLQGLRKVNKTYSGVEIKVEESGEHVIFGNGELYLDSLLHDLRYDTDIDIKISDPITKFAESVSEPSFTKISIASQNGENEITVVAEPMEEQLAVDIESGKLSVENFSSRQLAKSLRTEYQWDSLASRSVISFGPGLSGTNALLNDTIPEETNVELLSALTQIINQGFQWAAREGPLTNEPIRETKFKIIELKLSEDPLLRSAGQIIPMVRKACHVALLTSSPKLMEPYYVSEITTPVATMKLIDKLLEKRRGIIIKDTPLPATKLYHLKTTVPVIDSVGFESDVRTSTQGDALVSSTFLNWRYVPGDPLDREIIIPKLKPASVGAMARDFVMKTRKRKGLGGEPGVGNYVDGELREALKELGLV